MEMIPLEYIINKVIEENKVTGLDSFRELKRYQDRDLFLEDVDNDSSRELTRLIIEYNRADLTVAPVDRKPIHLFINSYGGTMTDAYAIVAALMMSKTPIYTVGIGVCYSAGGLVLMAGHKRFMYPLASFMFHEGSTWMSGDAGKVKDSMKFYDAQLGQMKNFILQKTKITPELYEQKQSNDWYLTAEDCLKYGIIDEIATSLY